MSREAYLTWGEPLRRVEKFLCDRTSDGELVTAKLIAYYTGVSQRSVNDALDKLLESGKAEKLWPLRAQPRLKHVFRIRL